MSPILQPDYRVVIAGQDVSSKLWPILKSIDVEDKDGGEADSCSVKLADPDGVVRMPQKDDTITIELGHKGLGVGLVYDGFVDGAISEGSKNGGRELLITGKSARQESKLKEQGEDYLDDATFGEAAKKWAREAGLEAFVDQTLSDVRRSYWSKDNESFQNWGQRMARQLGATFKIAGNRAIFVKRNGGLSAGGQQLATITAVWRENLINWSIAPWRGRPQFKSTRQRYYDLKVGRWRIQEAPVEDTEAPAERTLRFQGADENQSKSEAEAESAASERHKASGSAKILGDAAAKPEGTMILIGARPGVDGSYRMLTVHHHLDKTGGYTSESRLGQPHGAAGVDDRAGEDDSEGGE